MKAIVYAYTSELYKVVWLKCGCGGGSSERPFVEGGGGSAVPADEKEACNISRARGRVVELALCNAWEWFVTLTLNADKQVRADLDGYVKDLGVWVGNFNKKYGVKLKYLLIPEQHKDGSWHMHGLFHDVPLDALTVNQYGYYDLPYYGSRFGFISLSRIRDKERTARYITKYISKSMSARSDAVGKHLFYASHGLEGKLTVAQLNGLPVQPDAFEGDYTFSKWYRNADEVNRLLEFNV